MAHVFDPTTVQRETPLPEDVYLCVIDKAEEKHKNGNRSVSVCFKVLKGSKYPNRLIFDHINLDHHSEAAQEIGRQTLAKILDCLSMGDKPLNKFSDMHGKHIKIETKLVPHYQDNGDMQTKVKRYASLSPVDLNLLKSVDNQPIVDNKGGNDLNDIPF